jgi:DNA-directed RNA polymerase subunit M/transcription elongation factor TFIIS
METHQIKKCPDCKTIMTATEKDGIKIFKCPECGKITERYMKLLPRHPELQQSIN